MNYSEIEIHPIEVMYEESPDGLNGAKQTFTDLENKIDNKLSGRKFFGVVYNDKGAMTYRACVEKQPGEDAAKLGLTDGVIPGGKYIRVKILDWINHLDKIPAHCMAIEELYPYDETRPTIEYYRSEKELHLMVPVI